MRPYRMLRSRNFAHTSARCVTTPVEARTDFRTLSPAFDKTFSSTPMQMPLPQCSKTHHFQSGWLCAADPDFDEQKSTSIHHGEQSQGVVKVAITALFTTFYA
ncbi:uncharacterized protein K452DRAFT_302768 [Aplosporella prunicola CBS 121167]|uniref:Uncharacterized protein n=1 Tax=Aplosporella prunicola CBS 121167 TaxID=1176127 RepID=A0A6A6AXG2_9PEZI|nr:uncharacterized protein K452DRAFT_302768 [Aplosporella prunicola CBS 121167]KAF2136440.1 hypothetical protein K452DRAFT_302768 [Aplosporella prunicola CBS 121167]